MLTVENTVLIVIDMQEKLAKAMHDRENLAKKAAQMVNGAKVLGIPVIWTEQNPNGLGSTLPEIRERLVDSHPVVKFSFSCCGEPKFMEVVKDCGRKQVLVLGIECHVCVCQTIIDLKELGYEGTCCFRRRFVQDQGKQGRWSGEGKTGRSHHYKRRNGSF